ncbi:hypothetical protein ACA910_003672 [Epithemia clementina (nom. ined.)]
MHSSNASFMQSLASSKDEPSNSQMLAHVDYGIDLFDDDEIKQVLGISSSGLDEDDLFRSFIKEAPMQERCHRSPLTTRFNLFAQAPVSGRKSPLMPEQSITSFTKQAPHSVSLPQHSQHSQHIEDEEEEDEHEEFLEKPKRSLTAYNLFFKDKRERLLKILPVKNKKSRKAHGKIGFAEMARAVAANWKKISKEEKMEYEYRSELDKERFETEYAEWKKFSKEAAAKRARNQAKKDNQRAASSPAPGTAQSVMVSFEDIGELESSTAPITMMRPNDQSTARSYNSEMDAFLQEFL